MQNKRFSAIIAIAVILLSIPVIAMQFTTEVSWTLSDFIIAGVLLFGTGLLCELVLRKVKKASHRIAICGVILLLLVLTWAELAVGIFGTAFAGQ